MYLRAGRRISAGSWISPCIKAPPTTPTARPYTPIEGASRSTPRILPIEYIIGASAAHRKLRCELRMPITNPLMPNMTGATIWMRTRSTVSANLTGSVKPGARILRTTHGAKMAMAIPRTMKMIVMMLAMAEASSQAFSRSPRVKSVVKVGMKADASAPPAINWYKISGRRLEALKASFETPVPKAHVISMEESKLNTWPSMMASITVPASRAMRRFSIFSGVVESIHRIINQIRSRTALPVLPLSLILNITLRQVILVEESKTNGKGIGDGTRTRTQSGTKPGTRGACC